MEKKIYSIEDVRLTILKTNPPILQILSWGYVPTSGWKNPRLTEYIYIQPPTDGIWDFDFVAESPTGIVLPALFPVLVERQWKGDISRLKGVRVHASVNNKERLITDVEEFEYVNITGGDVPARRPSCALEIRRAE